MSDSHPELGVELAQVTTGMVTLHRRLYGKGPTKAKTYAADDTVVCILEGGFTHLERVLIDKRDVDAVLQVRRNFQEAMEDEFKEVVERALGRRVIAYVNEVHADPDLAVELFLLEPAEGDEAPE